MSYLVVDSDNNVEYGYFRLDKAREVLVSLLIMGINAHMFPVKMPFLG